MNGTSVWHLIMLRVFIVFTMKRKEKAFTKEKEIQGPSKSSNKLESKIKSNTGTASKNDNL